MTTIRLGCILCDRSDKDGITQEELSRCIAEGWTHIMEVQGHDEACTGYDNPADAPPGFNVMDWETHTGYCPECRED